MSRFLDRSRRVPLRDLTPADIEKMEARKYERDFMLSRHDMTPPECRCTGAGPVCVDCPERNAPRANEEER